MKRRRRWCFLITASAAVAALVCGCTAGQRDRADVRGRVTLDGEPLKLGSITLHPVAGGVVTGGLIQDGHFELTGRAAARLGTNRVSITASPTPTGRMIQDPTKPPGTMSPEMIGGVVADRFTTASVLQIDVVSGDNFVELAVESQ